MCGDLIGEFDDVLLAVRMLTDSTDLELQHHLLDLVDALCGLEENLLQLLDRDFVDVVIKLASLAHLNADQIGNLLSAARSGTGSGLASGLSSGFSVTAPASVPASSSAWVPDDAASPRAWLVAGPGAAVSNPPALAAQKGPFRVSELQAMCERGEIDATWLLAPAATDDEPEVEGSHPSGTGRMLDALVDTGRWQSLGNQFQLRMQLLFTGRAQSLFSPADVSLRCLGMLSRLARVHRSVDCRGLSFYPLPACMRLMSEPEHLRVLAQLLHVDQAAELLLVLV